MLLQVIPEGDTDRPQGRKKKENKNKNKNNKKVDSSESVVFQQRAPASNLFKKHIVIIVRSQVASQANRKSEKYLEGEKKSWLRITTTRAAELASAFFSLSLIFFFFLQLKTQNNNTMRAHISNNNDNNSNNKQKSDCKHGFS